jgi:hypothetical protein
VPTVLWKLARALYARDRRSLLPLARWALVAGVLSVACPVLADSDRPDLVNGTGDDPTQPLGKIELLGRYTEAPGPGVEDGTTKQVETNTPFGTPVWNQTGRLFVPFNFMIGWKPTEHTVISAEFGIPIIKDFPVYTFKAQLRVGYLF